jgi:hypothetical protein
MPVVSRNASDRAQASRVASGLLRLALAMTVLAFVHDGYEKMPATRVAGVS